MPDLGRLRQDLAHAWWLGRRWRDGVRSEPTLPQGIDRFTERWPLDHDDGPEDAPILLAATGWRSGSTMVQRLLMTDPATVVWGEPYNRLDLLRRMAGMFATFTPDYPTRDIRWPADLLDRDLTTEWVANLYPDGTDLLDAHRRFHDVLFGEPARRVGASRWGLKTVRLDAGHAHYLRLLFPRTRIVFLVRDPYLAYASYRRQGSRWYDRWPDRPVFTPTAFGRVWHRLATSFLRHHDELDALVVRYEDVVSGAQVDELAHHCGTDVDASLLGRPVTMQAPPRRFAGDVRRVELALLDREVRDTARRFGYSPPARAS